MKKNYFFALICLVIINASQAQVFHDLTDVGANVTAITARGNIAGSPPSNAFDNSYQCGATASWNDNFNPAAGSPTWIKVQFSSAKLIKGYFITSWSGTRNNDPRDWTFEGSLDNVTWVTLDTRSGINFGAAAETRFYSFTNLVSYTYYRLSITETKLTTSTTVELAELGFLDNLILSGYVYKDDGTTTYGKSGTDTAFAGINVSIVDKANTVVATKTTDASGYYSFSSTDLMNTVGDFAVIVTPPADYIFVTDLPVMFRSGLTLPTGAYQAACGAVLFACYQTAEGSTVLTNRFLFGQGTYNVTSLDFGMKPASPSKLASAKGYALSFPQNNLITAASNGTFGTWGSSMPLSCPVRPAYADGTHAELYSSTATCNYVFDNITNTSSGSGTLWVEGDYNLTSFYGTLQDIAAGKSGAYQGSIENEYAGGWLKSYGATTGNAYDLFMAINGDGTGTTPVFTQTNLSLTNGEEYLITFNAKGANSWVQQQNGLVVNTPAIVIEIFDNSNNIIYTASKNFNYSGSANQDLPYFGWDQVSGVFTATNNGPFKVTIRASTTAATGNDSYIDNIALFRVRRVDYGDAPASYGTANAYHLIYPALKLGAVGADSNRVAQSGTSAFGDDNQMSDDEDGVTSSQQLAPASTTYSTTVNATNTTGSTATLCGWVDFDGSGAFSASEASCTSVPNGFSGNIILHWTTSNPVSNTYARFRISTDANLNSGYFTGRLEDGEIEDYKLNNGTLPISLTDFNAVLLDNGTVNLNWTTETESNTGAFIVMRSKDASRWTELDTLDAAGNSTEELKYQYTDLSPYNGLNYYRIKEVTEDGSNYFSDVRSVIVPVITNIHVYLLENPVHDQLKFMIKGAFNEATYSIFNTMGSTSTVEQQTTTAINALDISSLVPGVYSLVVTTDGTENHAAQFVIY